MMFTTFGLHPLQQFLQPLVFLILYYFALQLAYFFKLFYEMLSIITLIYLCVSSLNHSSSIQYLLKNSNASTLTMHFPTKHHEFLLTHSSQKRVTLCSIWQLRYFCFLPKRIDYRIDQLLSHLPINKSMFSTP